MLLEQAALEPQITIGKRTRYRKTDQSRATSKKFEFIASDADGRPPSNARAFIRSHVMRGKNSKENRARKVKSASACIIGVTESDKDEKAVQSLGLAQPPVYADRTHSNADMNAFIVALKEGRAQVASASLLLFASPLKPPHDLALVRFASDLNDSSRALLYRYFTTVKETMYPVNWCVEFEDSDLCFFHWLFEADSYLQSILFNVSAFQDVLSIGFAKRKATSNVAVDFSSTTRYYFTQTMKLLQKQIQDRHMQLHDSTVAVVIGLAIMADAVGDGTAYKTHVEGLKQIVRIRGGMNSFRHNRQMQMKIYRIDLGWCLKYGCQPDFFEDGLSWDSYFDKVFPQKYTSEPSTPSTIINTLQRRVNQKIFNVFLDMQRFSKLVNTLIKSQYKLQLEFFQDIMLSIQYRLLFLNYSPDTQFLNETVRIGLLAYQASIFLHVPGSNSRYDFLAERFHYIICRLDDCPIDVTDFKLWLLFVGSFISLDVGESALDAMIAELTAKSDWISVRNRLKNIMWVDAIHDTRGRNIFEAIQRRYQSK